MADTRTDAEILWRMHRLSQLAAANARRSVVQSVVTMEPESCAPVAQQAARRACSRAAFYLEEANGVTPGSVGQTALRTVAHELFALALTVELLQPGALQGESLQYLLQHIEAPRDPWPDNSGLGAVPDGLVLDGADEVLPLPRET